MAAGIELGNNIYDGRRRGKERAQNEALTGLAIEQQVIETARSANLLKSERFKQDQIEQSRIFDQLTSLGAVRVDGNMLDLDQGWWQKAYMQRPSEFRYAANLVANNSREMTLSPSGFQMNDWSMQAQVTDPNTGEVVANVPYFKQNSQKELKGHHDSGMEIGTVFAFAGKNADGSNGVSTENGQSGPDAPVATMGFEEIMRNLEFAYDTGILPRSGKPISQYAQLQNEIELATGAKKEVLRAQLANLDQAQARRDKIFLVQDYLSNNNRKGAAQQLRQLTAAAVSYGKDSPQFTGALNRIYDDIKVDQDIDNVLTIQANTDAAKYLKNYQNYKDKYVPGQTINHPDMDILAESLAKASPNDELTATYTEQAGNVSAIASELLPEAITALGKDKLTVKYNTKQARLANIEKNIADIKAGKSITTPAPVPSAYGVPFGSTGIRGMTYQAPATNKKLQQLEKNRRQLLSETETLKTDVINKYLLNNPEAAGAVNYLGAVDVFNSTKVNMAQAAQVANFSDPLQVLEAVNDGSLVITQEEMLANADYLAKRGTVDLNDVANLPEIRKLQVMANMIMTTDDKQRRQTIVDDFTAAVFPGAKTSGIVSENTDKIVSQLGVGKDVTTFGGFMSRLREQANVALSPTGTFGEELVKGTKRKAAREVFGPQGLLTQLESVIQRTGQANDDNFDYGAVQMAQQVQREIISQAFREYASDTGWFDFQGRSEIEYAGDWADGIVLLDGKLQYIAADGKTPVGDAKSIQDLRDEIKLPKATVDRLVQFARDNARAKGLI